MPDLGHCFRVVCPRKPPRTWGLSAGEHTRRGAGVGSRLRAGPAPPGRPRPVRPNAVPGRAFGRRWGARRTLGTPRGALQPGPRPWTPCGGVARC